MSALSTFLGLVLATFGTLVMGALRLPSVPDLFLLPVGFAARRGAAGKAMLVALAAGFLEDSLTVPGRLFGLHAFAKVLVAFCLALVGARTLVEKAVPFGALLAAGSAIEGAVVAGLLWILRGDLFLPEPGRLAVRVLGTGLLAAAARALLRYPWKEAWAARRRRKLA